MDTPLLQRRFIFERLFASKDGELLMSCFYDISLKSLSFITGVGQSWVRGLRKKRGLLFWPFNRVCRRMFGVDTFDSVEQRRRVFIEHCSDELVRSILKEAQKIGDMQKRM